MPSRPFPTPSRLMLVALLAGAALPAGAAAQVTEGPLSPAGRLRVEVAPSFFHWKDRFGLREVDGRRVEGVEPLGFDLQADPATDLFPGVAVLESSLREVLDDPGFQAALGATRARVAHDVTRIPLRADLGVFDWLTVGVTVPFVLTRTEATVALRVDPAAANLGLSPAVTAPDAMLGFLQELSARADAAASRADALCAEGDPACAEAEALAGDAAALESGLRSAYGATPLFPVEGTEAGGALRARLDALNARLSTAGLGEVGSTLPLADRILDREGFERIFEDPLAGLQASVPGKVVNVWELGDVELTAAVRLLEGVSRDSAGAPARARWQVGARGLVRLGTGIPDSADVFFDLGSGDAQTDVEGGVFANVRVGSVGLWADARYGVQGATTLLRRAVPPDLVLAPVATRVPVRWTPGSYLQLEVSPRWHLTTELAVAATWRTFTKGPDTYELAASADPTLPIDPSVLEAETEATVHELGGGLVFSTLEAWRDGRTSVPFEVRFGVQAGVSGSGGRTPKGVRIQGGLRLYQRLWGGR